jgi:hypothetical protein
MALAVSAGCWCVLLAAVPPDRQNFPLNDDWAFARGALAFAKGQGIHYFGWASMPQLGQWLWSLPFQLVLGPTLFALRFSTIVVGWLGLWAFGDLLRSDGVDERRVGLLTAALAVNPLFFLLQGTFMTDVPALSFALVALALYGRAVAGGSLRLLAGAAAVALLAVTTRQNTASVCLVAAVLLWRARHLRGRLLWWSGVAVPLVAALAIHFWFQGRSDVRALTPCLARLPDLLLLPFLVVHFCGLSALPALAVGGLGPSRRFVAFLLVLLACAGAWAYFSSHLPYPLSTGSDGAHPGLFPYSQNMLTPWGAFAGSAFDGSFILGFRPLLLGWRSRLALTLLGCLGGAGLLARLSVGKRSGIGPGALVLFTIFQLLALLALRDLYDRYLLFLLPGALYCGGVVLPGTQPRRAAWPWALALLSVLTIVSVGLMHDWLAWNSARWTVGQRALARGIPDWEIEGGVEWNGWYAMADRPDVPVRGYLLPFTREWFSGLTGHFGLSFSEFPGTVTRDSEPYTLWLPPAKHRFFLIEVPLQRQARSGTGAANQAP